MNEETGRGVEGREDARGGAESRRVRERRNRGRRRRENEILREGRKAGEIKRD